MFKSLLLAFTIITISPNIALSEDQFLNLSGPYLGQTPPGDSPQLFAPGIISTGIEHSAAMFTPDGSEIWFGRMLPAKIYSMKIIDGHWTQPAIPESFTETFDLYPVLSPDGNKLFFTSARPIESGGEMLHRSQGQIWMIQRTPDGWSEPTRLSDKINIRQQQSCGSLGNNQNLYFTAKEKRNSMDIFCSKFIVGEYVEAENCTELNSPSPDHSPFVASDESYIIFSSFRGGQGLSDLFISFRTTDNGWTKPKNMGARINSTVKDEYPYVTPDGKYLFFNSNRPSELNDKSIPDGPGNIYWVSAKIIDELRPK